MSEFRLSVRPLHLEDIGPIVQYWLGSDKTFLEGMGVDVSKMPTRDQWVERLVAQVNQPIEKKDSYAIIWRVNERSVGHCNVSKIKFGEEAYMHLHLWEPYFRRRGLGTEMVKRALPYFFINLKLQRVCCEPYALNPAPNRALEKIGFTFINRYTTIPGFLNFEQEVNHWEMSYETFLKVVPPSYRTPWPQPVVSLH